VLPIYYFFFSILSVTVGFLPILFRKKDSSTITFLLFSLSISFWTLSNALYTISNKDLWLSNIYSGAALCIYTGILFLYTFPFKKKSLRGPSLYLSIPVLVIIGLSHSSLIISQTAQGHLTKGPLYPAFISLTIIGFLFGFVITKQKYKTLSGLEKQKNEYIQLSMLLFLPVSWILGIFLPAHHTISLSNLSVLSITSFQLALLYILLASRLRNMYLFIGKFVATFFVYFLFAFPYIAAVHFLDPSSFTFFLIPTIIYWGLVAKPIQTIVPPLQLKLAKLLSTDFYNHSEVLAHGRKLLSTCNHNKKLWAIVKHIFQDELHLNKVQFFVKSMSQKPDASFNNVESGPTITLSELSDSHSLVQTLVKTKSTIIHSRHAIHSMILESLMAHACIPIFGHDHLIGFILIGKKKNLSSITSEDIMLFHNLAKEIAVVIERLQPYEEVEQNLKRSLEIAEKAENEASYARLTRGIAHEIRNPLGILLSTIEHIADNLNKPEEIQKLVSISKDTILRLTNVTSSMLKYGNPVSSSKASTDITPLISDLMTVCTAEAKKRRITLSTQFSKTPNIIIDSVSINQAILNIILNAIQSIESDGEITVSTSLDTFLSPTTDCQTHAVKITIHDTGKGIPEENIDKLFDPFFSTKHSSAGLGLSIVKKIIHEHKGVIRISSKEGEFATVSIFLPIDTNNSL